MQQRDHRIRDLGRMVLALRPDLVFRPRKIGGDACYLVEDTVNSKYYSIGIPEYTFMSCLDGRTTVAQALSMTAKACPEEALTEEEVASICGWLIESELAFTAASADATRLATAAATKTPDQLSKFNPLYLKLPLCYPDRFFERMQPLVSWFYSKPIFLLGVILAMIAGHHVFDNWHRFLIASQGIFSPSRWLWLGVCWLVLKVVHEFSHGAVCKKFGGSVHESGLIFILFAPLAYVDVTSSWRFKSKWHRIYTAAAGMYIELIIASVAALVWAHTEPGLVNDLCFNVVLMASITTILFNANALMRFDGYYILSDLVDIPNLYSDGQAFLNHLGRKYALGLRSSWTTGSPSRDVFIKLYGVAAFFWRTSVTFFLILAAATMFEGAGILLAFFAAALWLLVPAIRFINYLFRGNEWEKPNKFRFSLVVLPLAALAVGLVDYAPWPGVKRAPAIVDYSPLTVCRARSPGFVREIHVESGQHVKAGQLIATLENEQLQLELGELEYSIEQSMLKCRALKQREELAAFQAEQKKLESLEKQHAEKFDEVLQLTIAAERGGTVIVRNPQALLGTYAKVGTEIVSIGDEAHKELRVVIDQQDVDRFSAYVGNRVSIRLPGATRFESVLTRLPPRASVELRHPSLYAPNGGPLQVRSKSVGEAESAEDKYELVKPAFTGIIELAADQSAQLCAGQRGVVWLARGQETIARHLLRLLRARIPDAFARQFNLAP